MKYKKTHIILTGLFPFFWLLKYFLSKKPGFIEEYYANGLYPYISKILRVLFGWIPFSIGDVLIVLLTGIVIYKIYKLIRGKFKTFFADILHFTTILSILYFCFYLFWGMNYFRKPLSEKLNIKTAEYSSEKLISTTTEIIKKINTIHLKIAKNDSIVIDNKYSNKELFTIAVSGYDKISETYPKFKYTSPSIKNSLLSYLHMYGGTSGFINPITGEAQINSLIPKTGMPFTICHEMAHQIGWNPENEANFVGFLAAINNENDYFKYAGYRMALRYLIIEVRDNDKERYKELWASVNKGVRKDFIESRDRWKKYENPIEPYIKKGYSSYLKANNQKKGIKSYSYVVNLLINYFNTTSN